MKIERKRYIVTRNNRKEIFCGLARHYQFKIIDDIGDTSIKTYVSKNKARQSFRRSWYNLNEEIEILPINEIIEVLI